MDALTPKTQVLTAARTKMSAALLICMAFGTILRQVDHFPIKMVSSFLGKEELL